jgi:hypothetical protein
MTTSPEQLMAEYMKPRGVLLKYAKESGLKPVDAEMAYTMGFPFARRSQGGIVIPYLNPFTHEPHALLMRIRYFPPEPLDKDGKEVRFAQPKGSLIEAYFDPHVDWKKVAKDPRIPIHFVEGEIKALAMNQNGFVTIGLGGVDMFGGENLTPWLRGFTA